MNPRNLLRSRALALVPIAALTATVATLEARDDAMPTSIRSDAAGTASAAPSTSAPGLSAPTSVSTPPATTAPGAVNAPVSVTRGGSPTGYALPPLRPRASTAITGTGAAFAAASSIPSVALAAYQRAASVIDQADNGCRLDWQLLAAIGQVESGNGTSGGSQLGASGVASPAIYGPVLNGRSHTARIADTDSGTIDGDKRFDRAVGPMQILPATWVQIAVDGDGDGRRDPQDINDAALASAVYLCSTGTDLSDAGARRAALLRYNHSASYATEVLGLAATYSNDDASAAVPGTFLLPPGSGSATPVATSSAASSAKPGHKHHPTHHHAAAGKHPKHHGHQHATGTTKHDAAQSGQQPKPIEPVGPGSSLSAAKAATAAQLDDLCRTAIATTYPSATDEAAEAARTECVTKLTGLTLSQARTQVDDLVTDPDFGTTFPDLGPAATPTPTGTASTDPSSSGPSGTPSGGATDDPSGTPPESSAASSDPSASASSTASSSASSSATATSSAG